MEMQPGTVLSETQHTCPQGWQQSAAHWLVSARPRQQLAGPAGWRCAGRAWQQPPHCNHRLLSMQRAWMMALLPVVAVLAGQRKHVSLLKVWDSRIGLHLSHA